MVLKAILQRELKCIYFILFLLKDTYSTLFGALTAFIYTDTYCMSFESFTPKNEHKTTESIPALFDNEGAVAEYHKKISDIDAKIAEIDTEIEHHYHSNHSDALPSEISLTTIFKQHEALHAERVTAQANYPFIAQRTAVMQGMHTGEPGRFDKPKQFTQHYDEQITEYDKRIDSIFNSTNVGNATEFNVQPFHLGIGNINEVGSVFYDATPRNGIPLTIRQKNIIEAHEKGHGLRDFTAPGDITIVKETIDSKVLADIAANHNSTHEDAFPYNYLRTPEEIIERMAQLKNYFGMKDNEQFTKEHLEYARHHYVIDTQLDNLMSEFFACITKETEPKFLSVMNSYPI